MRIGLPIVSQSVSPDHFEQLLEEIGEIERRGFHSAWLNTWWLAPEGPVLGGLDAMATLTAAAARTSTIELGTSIVPIYHRPPAVMAQGALTAAAACRGRFTLGLGVSHPRLVEGVMGLSYLPPAARMRAYLEALDAVLTGDAVDHSAGDLSVRDFRMPDARPVPVLLAALGPAMLKVAGELASGTITIYVGPKTLEREVVPRIRAAAAAAGRPEPRIVAGNFFAVTDDPQHARAVASAAMRSYADAPAYRRMLEAEGVSDPADLVVAGSAQEVRAMIRRIEAIGVTDLWATVLPVTDAVQADTLDVLSDAL